MGALRLGAVPGEIQITSVGHFFGSLFSSSRSPALFLTPDGTQGPPLAGVDPSVGSALWDG